MPGASLELLFRPNLVLYLITFFVKPIYLCPPHGSASYSRSDSQILTNPSLLRVSGHWAEVTMCLLSHGDLRL